MALFPALILALALPASAQLRNERGCTSKQEAAVSAAVPEAKKRVAEALKNIKAKDPAVGEAGRAIFPGSYDESAMTAVLDLMVGALGTAVVHCSTDADKYCGNRGGYVRSDDKGTVHLCPLFFSSKPESRIRTIVHESAHMAHPSISESGGENYCVLFSCDMNCGDGPTDASGKSYPARVADNWSLFAHCASKQPSDDLDPFVAGSRKKNSK